MCLFSENFDALGFVKDGSEKMGRAVPVQPHRRYIQALQLLFAPQAELPTEESEVCRETLTRRELERCNVFSHACIELARQTLVAGESGQDMNEQANPKPDARIRVVVADDHPVIRGMVRSVLQQHSRFEVCGEAENGAEAIEKVKQVRPDAVVLNITMPQVNGLEAAREIRKLVPDTAIVILSTHADKHFVAEARKHGARAYVAKSKVGQALVEALEAAVKGDDFVGLE